MCRLRAAGAVNTIRNRILVIHIWIDGVMMAISETGESFKIDIWVVRPITGVLLVNLMRDPVDEDLDFVDRSLCTVTTVDS